MCRVLKLWRHSIIQTMKMTLQLIARKITLLFTHYDLIMTFYRTVNIRKYTIIEINCTFRYMLSHFNTTYEDLVRAPGNNTLTSNASHEFFPSDDIEVWNMFMSIDIYINSSAACLLRYAIFILIIGA